MDASQLHKFLSMADAICSVSQCFLEEIVARKDYSFVAKIHIGLGNKMRSTFKALIADASYGRAEAVHHLKTLVESYIYVRWIGQEDTKARLVYARMCKEKKKFFESNPSYLPKEDAGIWEATGVDFVKSIKSEWKAFKDKKIKKLSCECGLFDVYSRVYKLACEPAHISDLMEFIPNNENSLIGRQATSAYWAFVALDYGSFVMISVLSDCETLYKLNRAEEIKILKTRYELIRT